MALIDYLNLTNDSDSRQDIKRDIFHVTTEPTLNKCIKCDSELKYYYSEKEITIELLDCELHIINNVFRCPNPECKKEDGKWLTYKSSEVGAIVLPKHKYGNDVLLKIGELRFQDKYTIQRTMAYLYKNHGILIDEAEVYRYQLKYLELLKGFQDKRKEGIKEKLKEQGGWILAIDGTRSNKSKTLYIARDEIHGITLNSKILRKGNPEDLREFISSIINDYGKPNAAISDAEWGLFSALKELLPDIPIQYCQRHFLHNLGEDLMDDDTSTIKKLIEYKIKKKL